ncbi:hypothetical protein L2D00_10085 [Hyphomonadaceae bacterium BL14]|nr:hypothetical protein L2D00_10085 [Hyphomonadaceae bacterium BL14]
MSSMIWLPVSLVFASGVGLAIILPSASPTRRPLVLRFLLAIIIFLHIALGVHAIGLPPIVMSVAFTPLAEELVRLYVLRGRKPGLAPNWRAAVYTGLLFALFEMNRLVRMINTDTLPDHSDIGLGPETYVIIAAPVHFLIHWAGHSVFGLVMIALWRRPLLRYLAPVLLHGMINWTYYL